VIVMIMVMVMVVNMVVMAMQLVVPHVMMFPSFIRRPRGPILGERRGKHKHGREAERGKYLCHMDAPAR